MTGIECAVWKYCLSDSGELFVPQGSKFLCVEDNRGEAEVAIYVLVPVVVAGSQDVRKFDSWLLRLVPTGRLMDEPPGEYLGTAYVSAAREVWHLFDKVGNVDCARSAGRYALTSNQGE